MQIITPTAILRDWGPDDAEPLVRHADNPRVASTLRDAICKNGVLLDEVMYVRFR